MSNILFNKKAIVCPICGKTAREIPIFNGFIFSCDSCDFKSIDPKCVDVSYKDELSAPLSNLYPNSFKMHCSYSNITLGRALVTYPSMETFLQSLKIKDPSLQYYFIKNYSAMDAKKMSAILDGWKKEQLLYFDGKAYARDSEDYLKLITTAYDALYNTNPVFREIILPRFKGYYIIHSIGADDKSETVLTETEFRYQINRLIARLDE